ncbi:MAG: DUF1501 domain-containing protein, partial [Xanthobacteraceae bacterium]
AGKGAAIQRHFMHRLIEAGQPLRPTPYSYVLTPHNMGFLSDSALAAMMIGRHPGYAQPIMITLGDPAFANLLGRSQMTAEADQLIDFYRNRFGDHLRFQGAGNIIRSAGFHSYDTAVNFLLNAAALAPILTSGVLTVNPSDVCAPPPPWGQTVPLPNQTQTGINVATVLLTAGDARYVCLFDGGVNGGGYDTHQNDHLGATSSGIFNLCTELAAHIQDPALPLDPNKINLDDTMIVINTEFGRWPTPSGGRDHWPLGFAQILIGGPVNGPPPSGQQRAPQISGGIDTSWGGALPIQVGGQSVAALTPTDLHAAVLLAAGVDPLAQDNFHVGVEGLGPAIEGSTDFETLINLRTRVLGVP